MPSFGSSSGSPGSVEERAPDRPAPEGPTGWSSSVGWGLALTVAGALLLAVQFDVPISWELVLPAALVVVGLLLLAVGHRGLEDGLVGLGLVLAAVALVVWWVPGTEGMIAGTRVHEVTDPGDLEDAYGAAAGALTLDLRELELPDGVTELTARLGMGELQVLLPADVTVSGGARVGLGEASGFGRSSGGVAPSTSLRDAGASDGQVLDLDLQVGLGRIEVQR